MVSSYRKAMVTVKRKLLSTLLLQVLAPCFALPADHGKAAFLCPLSVGVIAKLLETTNLM
jgi:hypothetical protein